MRLRRLIFNQEDLPSHAVTNYTPVPLVLTKINTLCTAMKLSAVLLSAVLVVAAAKRTKRNDSNDNRRKNRRDAKENADATGVRKLSDDQFFANAFGAVQTDYPASKWNDFLVDGPLSSLVEVDLTAGDYELRENIKGEDENGGQQQNDRELWYQHNAGWFSIHTDGDRALDVRKKNSEECFGLYEGIENDGWRFGIATGLVPDTEDETDTYLMLFSKWHPYTPVYQAFRGAYKLCIGEKSRSNTAYMIIYTGEGCHLLIGKPDSGRDNDLPKLKIRDQDYGWHRQRNLRSDEEEGTEMVQRELWYDNDHYDKTYGKGVVVRFRDGSGMNFRAYCVCL